MRIGHERCGIVGGELFVFLVKLRILVGFAECLLDNLERSLGVPGGRTKGWPATLKARCIVITLRSFSDLAKLSSSGTLGKRGMLFPLGNLDDRVKVDQVLFEPLRVAPEHGVGAGRSRVDLTAHQAPGPIRLRHSR